MPNIKEMYETVDTEFFDDGIALGYILETIDDERVRIGKQIWEQSTVLREFCVAGDKPYKVRSDGITVRQLLKFHKQGKLPVSLRLKTCLLSLIYQLRMVNIIPEGSQYRRLLCHDLVFNQLESDCPRYDVLNLFSALCELPLRSREAYMKVLHDLKDFCDGDPDFMIKAVNILKEKFDPSLNLGLHLLPISFATTNAVVAIMSYLDEKRLYMHQDGTWHQVELLGVNFQTTKYNIREFYLKYGSYIIFKDDSNSVFFKNLDDSKEPSSLADDCQQMLVADRHVFLLTLPNKRCLGRTILKWNGSRFTSLKSDTSFGSRMSYDVDRELLGVLGEPNNMILIYRYQNEILSLVANVNAGLPLQHFCFYERKLHTWGENMRRVAYSDPHFATLPDDNLPLDEDTTDVRVVNKRLFKYCRGQWHACHGDGFCPLTISGRAEALSEVVFLPW